MISSLEGNVEEHDEMSILKGRPCLDPKHVVGDMNSITEKNIISILQSSLQGVSNLTVEILNLLICESYR
jgi:hypothetical protein